MRFFEFMMRNAAPILFWTAVILFVAAVVTPFTVGAYPTFAFAGYSDPTTSIFLHSLTQGLGAAAWPFLGAALIWTLQRRGAPAA